MHGRGLRIIVLAIFLLIPGFVLLSPAHATPLPTTYTQTPRQILESHVRARMPLEHTFGQVRREVDLLSGRREINGIFISEAGLIRRIGPINDDIVRANISATLTFANNLTGFSIDDTVPVFISLLPTSAAILQESLPPFSNTINQRQFIEDVYSALSGHVSSINVFETLLTHRHEYIYYRTHNNFTSLGGYYIFTQLHSRMLGSAAPPRSMFTLSYPGGDFLGDLYQTAPYRGVQPDRITLFHWSGPMRYQHIVTHTGVDSRQRIYHTLYPRHMTELERHMDIFLGGLSSITDIQSTVPYTRTLLILGDETALAYAPFLANHYRRVTIIDIFSEDASASGIMARNYSQVLLAVSTETFMTREISAVTLERLAVNFDF